jgi:hypothetical protein
VKSDAETEFVQTQRLPQSKLLLERVFLLTRSTNKVQRERKLSRTEAVFQRNSYEVFHKCELNQKKFEKHESICSISASSCRFGLESTVRPALGLTIPRDSAVDKGVAGTLQSRLVTSNDTIPWRAQLGCGVFEFDHGETAATAYLKVPFASHVLGKAGITRLTSFHRREMLSYCRNSMNS